MNVLLISTNRNCLPMAVMPVGACLVAEAAEQAGHSVNLLDLMFADQAHLLIESTITKFQPDVIALSVRNIDNNGMQQSEYYLDDLKSIMELIRTRTQAPLILGGAALGVMPEAILRLTDASCAVIGEGAGVFPLLLERLSRGETYADVPGIALIENGTYRSKASVPSDFSDICQVPDYRRWLDISAYRSRLATAPLQTKTGCEFRCVYCTYPGIEGNTCRLKEAASVADAVMRLSAAGFHDIEIVDSVFNAPLEHALDVCAALARTRSKARIQCLELNPRYVTDELMNAMTHAGFTGIGITLESAADAVLEGLNKGFSSHEVHRAAEVVSHYRIPCAWIFLFGGPGETKQTVRETIHFARTRIRPGDIAFFNTGIRIYPGTQLETIARRQGILTCSTHEMLAPSFYVSPEVETRWIEQELKQAMSTHLNFIDMGSLSLPFLPTIHRFGSKLGLRPPLWRYTRLIRRTLRMAGMDV